MSKSLYDFLLEYGQQVDFWPNMGAWGHNSSAEEFVNDPASPFLYEKQINGVILTFEMLEKLKDVPAPEGIELHEDPFKFWLDILCKKYSVSYNPPHIPPPEYTPAKGRRVKTFDAGSKVLKMKYILWEWNGKEWVRLEEEQK